MKIQSINQSTNQSKAKEQSFGIKFVILPKAVDSFMTATKKAASKTAGPKGGIAEQFLAAILLTEPTQFLQKICRDVIAHNKTEKNHFIYDDVIKIAKIDIRYPKRSDRSFFGFSQTPMKEMSLLKPSSTKKACELTRCSTDFNYHLIAEDGSEFKFTANDTRIHGNYNPADQDFAAKMQDKIIASKDNTPESIDNDLAFLSNKTFGTSM